MVTKEYEATISDSRNGVVPIEELWEYGARIGAANFIAAGQQEATVQPDIVVYQTPKEKGTVLWVEVKERPGLAYPELKFRQSKSSLTGGSVVEELRHLLRYWTQDQVQVYPGYSVSSIEYERRFKGVDLDHFREVMAPELFKAYVQTMGSIEGWGIEPEHRYKGKD